MKRILLNFIIFLLIIGCTLGFSACGNQEVLLGGAEKQEDKYFHHHIASNEFYQAKINKDGSIKSRELNVSATADDRHSYVQDLLQTMEEWENIVDIRGSNDYVAGLTEDGDVLMAGNVHFEDCNNNPVESWEDIVQIAGSPESFAGLKDDGTVLIAGLICENADVSQWTDIVQVETGNYHVIGLKEDGTVVADGSDGASDFTASSSNLGRCANTEDWTGIVNIAAGDYVSLAVTEDGRVLSTDDDNPYADVTNAKQVAAFVGQTAVLLENGKVIPDPVWKYIFGEKNEFGTWEDIEEISCNVYTIAGMTEDGYLRSHSKGQGGVIIEKDGVITEKGKDWKDGI